MSLTRRTLILTGAAATLGACASSRVATGAEIDQKVAISRNQLFSTVPDAQFLAERSSGYLIIPEIIKGGLFLGGAYGEGALIVGGATVDYISVAAASFGLQIGAQSFSQALFFMTPEALADFRQTDGWVLGATAEAALLDSGAGFGTSTNTIARPIYQVLYGQRGLILGASLEGAKYNRLIR